jgi:hypothetical protein
MLGKWYRLIFVKDKPASQRRRIKLAARLGPGGLLVLARLMLGYATVDAARPSRAVAVGATSRIYAGVALAATVCSWRPLRFSVPAFRSF